MSDEQTDLWERQDGEPNNWYSRFEAYLHMGPSRSLNGAFRQEIEKSPKKPKKAQLPSSWKEAARQWNWKARAEAWDEYRRKQVFTQGNAYDLARIEKLNHYSERLEEQINLMLDSLPKKIKKPWFNNFLYEKYLQTMEALAQETGGRVKKQEITGKDGSPLEATRVVFYLPENGDDLDSGYETGTDTGGRDDDSPSA